MSVSPDPLAMLASTAPCHSLALFGGARATIATMKIATFNVNGVNGRLPVLLRWLKEASPDVVCLQELKSETFPQSALRAAGYEGIWSGQKSWNGVAILARGKGMIETRRALPGDEDDLNSRYIEAAVDGLLIGCLYLPNGNPFRSEKFDFKLRWFERLIAHGAELLASGAPIVLAGDYNVMPTELDVYKPERWVNDALFRVEVRAAFSRLVAQGWTDALRTLHPAERIYTFWDYFRNAYARDAGLRIDHLLLSPSVAARLKAAGVDRAVRGWEKASDHAPVWIEVAEGAAERPKRTSRLSSGGRLASKTREQTSTRGCKSVGLTEALREAPAFGSLC
jgi:exodeoxyribonuclease III